MVRFEKKEKQATPEPSEQKDLPFRHASLPDTYPASALPFASLMALLSQSPSPVGRPGGLFSQK